MPTEHTEEGIFETELPPIKETALETLEKLLKEQETPELSAIVYNEEKNLGYPMWNPAVITALQVLGEEAPKLEQGQELSALEALSKIVRKHKAN